MATSPISDPIRLDTSCHDRLVASRTHVRTCFRCAAAAVALWGALNLCGAGAADEPPSSDAKSNGASPAELGRLLAVPQATGLIGSALGVTPKGTTIPCWLAPDDLDFASPKIRILLIGGADGRRESVAAVRTAVERFHATENAKWRESFALSAVPAVDPDRVWAGPSNANGDAAEFPPPSPAYGSAPHAPAAYLWRWIGMHAPDLVVDVRHGEEVRYWVPQWGAVKNGDDATLAAVKKQFANLRHVMHVGDNALYSADEEPRHARSLVGALVREAACETGVIPAMRLTTNVENAGHFLFVLLASMQDEDVRFRAPSPARAELRRRTNRSPREVAESLSKHYGHTLPAVEYIPAVAMIGRLRLAQQTHDQAVLPDLQRIVAPYARGEKSATPKSGSGQSGHLIFVALADALNDALNAPKPDAAANAAAIAAAQKEARDTYVKLVRKAADQMFDDQGRMLDVMPYHSEMSDALFMGGPILAAAGRLTGEKRYWQACRQHITFMQKLDLRPDGLYRHSPLDETAWGRGNGFPALGLALILSELPQDHPDRARFIAELDAHLAALLKHQDPTGCWHQVVDRPESYRELSCTCMIAFAMARGVRLGWLDENRYQPAIDKAWYAVRSRVDDKGRLVDVCTGTGKQKSLRDYYDRDALLGADPRGGAMALLIATELMAHPSRVR